MFVDGKNGDITASDPQRKGEGNLTGSEEVEEGMKAVMEVGELLLYSEEGEEKDGEAIELFPITLSDYWERDRDFALLDCLDTFLSPLQMNLSTLPLVCQRNFPSENFPLPTVVYSVDSLH